MLIDLNYGLTIAGEAILRLNLLSNQFIRYLIKNRNTIFSNPVFYFKARRVLILIMIIKMRTRPRYLTR